MPSAGGAGVTRTGWSVSEPGIATIRHRSTLSGAAAWGPHSRATGSDDRIVARSEGRASEPVWQSTCTTRGFSPTAPTVTGSSSCAANPLIQGFTTNPTLMRAAGVEDYESFAIDLVGLIPDRPISFEVFSDDAAACSARRSRSRLGPAGAREDPDHRHQRGEHRRVQRALAAEGVQLNVTALLTLDQVEAVADALAGGPHSFVSVFAGRVADTGRDPVPHMKRALEIRAHDNSNCSGRARARSSTSCRRPRSGAP